MSTGTHFTLYNSIASQSASVGEGVDHRVDALRLFNTSATPTTTASGSPHFSSAGPSLRLHLLTANEERDGNEVKCKEERLKISESQYASSVSHHDRCFRRDFHHSHQLQQRPSRCRDVVVPYWLIWPLFHHPFTSSLRVARLHALLIVALAAVLIAWRRYQWAWYVEAGLTADFGLRFFCGDRCAPLSLISDILTTLLSIASLSSSSDIIYAAPRQFASLCYTIITLAAVILSGEVIGQNDPQRISMTVVLGILLLLHVTEVLGISVTGLCFESLVHTGWISDEHVHRAHAIVAQDKLMQKVAQEKAKYSGSKHSVVLLDEHHDKYISTSTAPQVIFSFEGLVFAAKAKSLNVVRNCSIVYAFPLLGVAGLTDMWYYLTFLYGIDDRIWKSLAVFLAILYALFLIAQTLRFYLVPSIAFRELQHPQLRYIYLVIFTVPLLSIDYGVTLDWYYGAVILWMTAPLVLGVALLFIRDWIIEQYSFELVNASWLITAISLIVVAFELPQVYTGLSELAWLWLAPGLFLWVLFVVLTFVRLWFTNPLPDSQRYTIFLIVSTGSVATAAILFQDPAAANQLIGPYSFAAEFFHWFTTFTGLLCYLLLFTGYFCRTPFSISYWAVSFPSAGLALIFMFYEKIGHCSKLPSTLNPPDAACFNNQDSYALRNVVILLVVNAVVSNVILGLNTVLAVLQKRMFLPMPQWSPISIVQLQHTAFRTSLYLSQQMLTQLCENNVGLNIPSSSLVEKVGESKWFKWRSKYVDSNTTCNCSCCFGNHSLTHEQLVTQLVNELTSLHLAVTTMMKIKHDVLWPTVQLWLPEVYIDHFEARPMVNIDVQLENLITDVIQYSNVSPPSGSIILDKLQKDLTPIAKNIHTHLDLEEVAVTPLVFFFNDMRSSNEVVKRMWQIIPVQTWRNLIPWILKRTPVHTMRMALIDCFFWSMQEASTMLGRWLSGSLDPFLYSQLCVDYPTLRAHSPSQYTKLW